MPKRLTPHGEAASPVEPIVTGATLPPKAAAKRRQAKPKATSGTKYVRNLHHIQARVTLTTGREIHLEPRGQREDLDIVNEAEQEDPRFLANIGVIFEVIEAEVATAIIAKQRHNAKNREHDVWQHLRNERGEAYENRNVRVEAPQVIQVGRVEKGGDTRHTSGNTEVVRTGPQITSVPGSIGDPATESMLQSIPDQISPDEYSEFLAWKRFKAAMEAQEAEDYRESLNVTIRPLEVETNETAE